MCCEFYFEIEDDFCFDNVFCVVRIIKVGNSIWDLLKSIFIYESGKIIFFKGFYRYTLLICIGKINWGGIYYYFKFFFNGLSRGWIIKCNSRLLKYIIMR